jgi:DNA-binding Lrp family transcriptional regulator
MTAQNQIDDLDRKILEMLKPDRGTKLAKLSYLLRVKDNTLRYRLLTLQVMGLVRVIKQRGSVTYFLSKYKNTNGDGDQNV